MARQPHPMAGKTVVLHTNDPDEAKYNLNGAEFRVEDYWENVYGQSWMTSSGNPAAILYAIRSGLAGLPTDNEVVYGKVGGLGHLVHTSELGEEVA